MNRPNWKSKEIDKLLDLKRKGYSDQEVALELGRTFPSVSAKIQRYKNDGTLPKSSVPKSKYPMWNEPLKTEGDALILTDIEAPFQHSEFINRVLDLADTWGIQTLHLAGDLLHYNSLSKWGSEWTEDKDDLAEKLIDILEEVPAKTRDLMREKLDEKGLLLDGGVSGELAEARAVFRSFSSFKEKIVCLGNHDDRYLRALDKALSPREILHQIDVSKDDSWKIAPYYYSMIETEQGLFRAEHPRGSGKSAAIDYAIQYHSHIIMGHSHRWAVQRDPSGDYWAIQTGHCVDERRLAYVGQRTAKRDAHVLGATIIRGGFPFVLCPETPWDMMKRM